MMRIDDHATAVDDKNLGSDDLRFSVFHGGMEKGLWNSKFMELKTGGGTQKMVH